MADNRPTTAAHVERARAITKWLAAAAPGDSQLPDAGADLADLIYSAADIADLLEELIACDPNTTSGREGAAHLASNILVQLESELKFHTDSVLPLWSRFVERLGEPEDVSPKS